MPGHEFAMGIFPSGLAILASEVNTKNWLNQNYGRLMAVFFGNLQERQDPDLQTHFFDTISRLVELFPEVIMQFGSLPSIFTLSLSLIPYLSTRGPCRAFLNCMIIIFSSISSEITSTYISQIVQTIITNLSNLNSNTYTFIAQLFITLRTHSHPDNFQHGVTSALSHDIFAGSKFKDKDRGNIVRYFMEVESETPLQMKNLVGTLGNIMKGFGGVDDLVSVEIRIAARKVSSRTIDIT